MTLQQIKYATGSTANNAQKFLEAINATCEKFAINTPIRQLCFLAQVGHESGGLYYTEEIASGKAYEGREDLGNTQPGDGVRFKGRGLIQITGRANYKKVSEALGVDFVANPNLLGGANIENATLSSGWFWGIRNLNNLADKIDIAKPIDGKENYPYFILITKKINGGSNGLEDRLARYKSGLPLFRLSPFTL